MAHDLDSWWPDELVHAGRENLDAVHVARYDAKEDAGAAEEVRMLAEAGILGPTSTVVDLGAGTGQFALAAGAVSRRVVAVDVSPVMLARLERKIRDAGLRTIECVSAGFLTYDHQGPAADLVYSRYALHHLPDFWKAMALSRAAGVLRPGGTLRLSDVVYHFAPAEAEDRLEAWIAGATAADAEQGWTRAELAEHVRDEHSTFTWLLEPMIDRAGFDIQEADYSDSGVFARYLCTRR